MTGTLVRKGVFALLVCMYPCTVHLCDSSKAVQPPEWVNATCARWVESLIVLVTVNVTNWISWCGDV